MITSCFMVGSCADCHYQRYSGTVFPVVRQKKGMLPGRCKWIELLACSLVFPCFGIICGGKDDVSS
jgi:hypothetical protein